MRLYAREEQDSVSYIYTQYSTKRKGEHWKKKKGHHTYRSRKQTTIIMTTVVITITMMKKKKNRRKPQFSEETKIGHFGQSCEYTKVRLKSHLQDSKKKKKWSIKTFFRAQRLELPSKKKKKRKTILDVFGTINCVRICKTSDAQQKQKEKKKTKAQKLRKPTCG